MSIENDVSYITGFTILPEERRTSVFLSLKLILEMLRKRKIKTIWCLTEKDGYPNKLYKKLGFETLFYGTIYAKK